MIFKKKEKTKFQLNAKQILIEIDQPGLPNLQSVKIPSDRPKILTTISSRTPQNKPTVLERPSDLYLMKKKLCEKGLFMAVSGAKILNSKQPATPDGATFASIFKDFFIAKGILPRENKREFKIKNISEAYRQKIIHIIKKQVSEDEENIKIAAFYKELKPFYPFCITSKFILAICENATIKLIGKNKGSPELLIMGGLGNGTSKEIISCKLSNKVVDNKGFAPNHDLAVYGHSAETIGNSQVILFGGCADGIGLKRSEFVNQHLESSSNLVVIDNSRKSVVSLHNIGFQKPKGRKFHASCLLEGNYMFIFGGMKRNYKFLNDIWIFDIEENQWHEFFFDLENDELLQDGIAYHRLAIISSTIQFVNEQKDKFSKEKMRFRTEGSDSNKKTLYLLKSHKKQILLDIYLFGGINEQNRLFRNKLWQLGMNNAVFYFKEVEIKGGFQPEPRYSHTMNSYLPERKLIVVGGKNSSGYYLSDINVFSFASRIWERWNLVDNVFGAGIAGHCSEIYENCLFIYGGISNEGFRSSDIVYFKFV